VTLALSLFNVSTLEMVSPLIGIRTLTASLKNSSGLKAMSPVMGLTIENRKRMV